MATAAFVVIARTLKVGAGEQEVLKYGADFISGSEALKSAAAALKAATFPTKLPDAYPTKLWSDGESYPAPSTPARAVSL